ncbi:hypothetical protein EIP86_008313 [Pleurotus ostreatoroseus]|nr:hypothetical protein EIP86_008313 [Pleurotus ostreatoroseus]
MFILPEEGNYLTRPEYHPTFLTNPRPAPSPQGPRRERSRGRQRTRSGVLARLTSTKSSRKARSLDGRSTAESASSIYSQASATTTVWMEVEGKGHGEPTTLPPLPAVFRLQQTLSEEPLEVLASPPPSRPHRKLRPKAHVLARHLARAGNNTLDSDPFVEVQRQSKMLKDSLAYPLSTRAFSPMTPHKDPGSFYATTLTFPSPPSNSSSPTPVRPSTHVAYPSVPTRGTFTPQPQSLGSTDLQDFKSSHSVEDEIVRSKRRFSGEQGVIGYQLPYSWRSGQISRIQSPLDGLTYKLTSSIVQ